MKRIFIIVLSGLSVLNSFAAQADSTRMRGFGNPTYTISGSMEYAYNTAWGSYANVDVQSLLPINPYFEMGVNLQASFANVYTFGAVLRPKFVLPVGELFIDTDLRYKAVARAKQSDINWALSLGYRMDYVRVQLGCFGRVLSMWGVYNDRTRSYINEPFNLLYRLEVFCRPQTCNWNIHLIISDYDDYQFERFCQPLFLLGGRYDVDEHWRVGLDVTYKHAGMFSMAATTYGCIVKAGFTYRF